MTTSDVWLVNCSCSQFLWCHSLSLFGIFWYACEWCWLLRTPGNFRQLLYAGSFQLSWRGLILYHQPYFPGQIYMFSKVEAKYSKRYWLTNLRVLTALNLKRHAFGFSNQGASNMSHVSTLAFFLFFSWTFLSLVKLEIQQYHNIKVFFTKFTTKYIMIFHLFKLVKFSLSWISLTWSKIKMVYNFIWLRTKLKW